MARAGSLGLPLRTCGAVAAFSELGLRPSVLRFRDARRVALPGTNCANVLDIHTSIGPTVGQTKDSLRLQTSSDQSFLNAL